MDWRGTDACGTGRRTPQGIRRQNSWVAKSGVQDRATIFLHQAPIRRCRNPVQSRESSLRDKIRLSHRRLRKDHRGRTIAGVLNPLHSTSRQLDRQDIGMGIPRHCRRRRNESCRAGENNLHSIAVVTVGQPVEAVATCKEGGAGHGAISGRPVGRLTAAGQGGGPSSSSSERPAWMPMPSHLESRVRLGRRAGAFGLDEVVRSQGDVPTSTCV